MAEKTDKKVVGRAEVISFPEQGLENVPARIDTGAKTSSIWASQATLENGQLSAILFGEGSAAYTGTPVIFEEFGTAVVANSTGHVQERYKVRLLVKIRGKKVRAWFTLADRSTQVYPVLIGRNVLLGKFVVDVKKGQVQKEAERERTQNLQSKVDEEE
jgi:hypothetical protein